MNPLAKCPWFLVVAAFVALIAAWAATITIAEKNKPVPIPVRPTGL